MVSAQRATWPKPHLATGMSGGLEGTSPGGCDAVEKVGKSRPDRCRSIAQFGLEGRESASVRLLGDGSDEIGEQIEDGAPRRHVRGPRREVNEDRWESVRGCLPEGHDGCVGFEARNAEGTCKADGDVNTGRHGHLWAVWKAIRETVCPEGRCEAHARVQVRVGVVGSDHVPERMTLGVRSRLCGRRKLPHARYGRREQPTPVAQSFRDERRLGPHTRLIEEAAQVVE
jgi:hypothetical protein